jgi:dTDP-4-dehydrorhamnose 3,5-epimerase
MGKLMRETRGSAFLVAVDIRKGSPTRGKWFGVEASEKNRNLCGPWRQFVRTIFELEGIGANLSPIETGAVASPVNRPAYSVMSK